jgi:hypothetical protein
VDPVPLVLDLHIALTATRVLLTLVLTDIYVILMKDDDDKIRKYHAGYNNNPPNTVSFMTAIDSTSGRLHSEFVRLLFLQAHQETDRFLAASGVQLAEHDRDQFHFRRAAFALCCLLLIDQQLKNRVGLTLAKAAASRIMLNLDGVPITSKSHTHPSHSQNSRLLTSSLSLGIPVPRTTGPSVWANLCESCRFLIFRF